VDQAHEDCLALCQDTGGMWQYLPLNFLRSSSCHSGSVQTYVVVEETTLLTNHPYILNKRQALLGFQEASNNKLH
jgi:hypothetical protein